MMAQTISFSSLTVELRAQAVEDKGGPFPGSNANFTLIRELGIFRVLDSKDDPLAQPSAVRLVVTYTSEDVEQVPEDGRLLVGIWFENDTLLWASKDPAYADNCLLDHWWGREWFTFEIPDPDPEGGQYTLDISGDLSDPGVGIGSG